MVESLWIRLESSAEQGEIHRITVTVSDIVIVASSTAMHRILTIADTMSQSSVRQQPSASETS